MVYAAKTEVPVEKTISEIRTTLNRYHATAFAHMEAKGLAMVVFEMQDRRISFKLPLPAKDSPEFTYNGNRQTRSPEKRLVAWEQACRSRWRGLLLCIKAKLESVDAGIETFEDAFLSHIQMPDGLTVGEHTRPMIKKAYETSTMQPLLPGPTN